MVENSLRTAPLVVGVAPGGLTTGPGALGAKLVATRGCGAEVAACFKSDTEKTGALCLFSATLEAVLLVLEVVVGNTAVEQSNWEELVVERGRAVFVFLRREGLEEEEVDPETEEGWLPADEMQVARAMVEGGGTGFSNRAEDEKAARSWPMTE